MQRAGLARRKRTACITCRDRKLKCSGEKPICRTCFNTGRECRGYGVAFPVRRPSSDDGSDVQVHLGGEGSRLTIPVSYRHPFRQQLLSLYLVEQLPQEIIHPSNQERNWLLIVPEMEALTPSLEAAIIATCAARLGQQNGDESLLQHSITFYHNSLRELQKAIVHPVLQYKDQTVATCLALSMYEFAECPEARTGGYLSHYNGALALLRHRGPGVHTTGLSHSVLRALRMHSIFNCIEQRSANFISSKDWVDLPWTDKPKDAHDRLLDLMLRLPKILSDVENLENVPLPSILEACVRRVRACWRFDSELNEWLQHLSDEVSGPIYWPEPPGKFVNGSGPEAEELFPVSYNFPSFIVAQTLVLYWLTRMMVCYQLGWFYQKLHDLILPLEKLKKTETECTCDERKRATISSCCVHFTLAQLPPLGYRSDWSHNVARNMCQSIGYFCQEKMRCAGPGCLVAPLMVLRWFWQHDYTNPDRSAEIAWLIKTLVTIHNRGNRIANAV